MVSIQAINSPSDGDISSLTRLMYCTTSLTNDLLISSFSLQGEFYPQSNPAKSNNGANFYCLVTSSGHTKEQEPVSRRRYLLLCHILVFRFGLVDLLLPFLIHPLLEIFLLPTETGHKMRISLYVMQFGNFRSSTATPSCERLTV